MVPLKLTRLGDATRRVRGTFMTVVYTWCFPPLYGAIVCHDSCSELDFQYYVRYRSLFLEPCSLNREAACYVLRAVLLETFR